MVKVVGIISILIFFLLPFPVGMIWEKILQREKRSWGLIYLYGSLTEIFATGIVAMPAVKLRLSFGSYRTASFVVLIGLALAGFWFLVEGLHKGKDNWRIQIHTEKNSIWAWGCVAAVFLLMASVFFRFVPAAETDMTAETIHTTVCTNTLYEYNPATGEKLSLGMYPQDKLVTLPLFYSLFYSLADGIGMKHFLYEMVPLWILILNFLVFWRWGEALFLGQKREKLRLPLFLVFYGMTNLFGDYLFITFSYKLLHQTWMGESVFVTVLLPFFSLQLFEMIRGEQKLSECLQEKSFRRSLWGVFLCAVTAVFCTPWREALVLCGIVIAASIVTAVIWRKQHERNN